MEELNLFETAGKAIFRGLLEFAPDAIIIVDGNGHIRLVNTQAEKMFGYGRDELIDQPVEILLPDRLKEPHAGHRGPYLAEPRTRPMGAGLDLMARRKDGSEIPVEISLSPLETNEGVIITSFIRDISERKGAEQVQHERDLLRAEQMSAVGQVAAGMAHELRNPLTSIKGLIQINQKELESRGMPVEDLVVIEHEIRRMERTLQAFLDFARPPEPARRRQDLAPLVDRTLALVRGRAETQGVTLDVSCPSPPVFADVDDDQIQQLLLNLVLNSLDVMPRGGVLKVALRPVLTGQVEVEVLDSGPGIATTMLPRVFEPFVSGKDRGLGLGLAVSRRLAEEHGGSLAASNRPQGGASFVLRLPAPPCD